MTRRRPCAWNCPCVCHDGWGGAHPRLDCRDRPTGLNTVTVPPRTTVGRGSGGRTESSHTPAPPEPPPTEPRPLENRPMKVTRQLLRDLGVCGPYVRKFSELFPSETYPDGVDLNQEICTANADDFDWNWAASEFLNYDGRRAWEDLRTSRTAEARAFGTGTAKQAAVFGHLFDTREDYRNPRVVELSATAAQRADEAAARQVTEARESVAYARREVERWTKELARTEARVPALEAEAAAALTRIAVRRAEERVAEVKRAEERLVTLREAAATATAELERLQLELPTDAAPEPTAAPEPATAEVS